MVQTIHSNYQSSCTVAIFFGTVNRSPPVSQAFAEASVSDHSPLTESSDPYAPIANSSVICRRPQTKPEIY